MTGVRGDGKTRFAKSSASLVAASLLAGLASCAAAPGASPGLQGTRWTLVGADRGVLAAQARDSKVTLLFSEPGRLGGHGGCNRYGAEYTLEGAQLRVGPVTATKMGCPGAAGEVERAWHAALSAPLQVAREGERLTLTAGDGQVLQFEAAAEGVD